MSCSSEIKKTLLFALAEKKLVELKVKKCKNQYKICSFGRILNAYYIAEYKTSPFGCRRQSDFIGIKSVYGGSVYPLKLSEIKSVKILKGIELYNLPNTALGLRRL